MENFLNKLENIAKTRPSSVVLLLVFLIFVCAIVYAGVKAAFLVLGILLAITLLAYACTRSSGTHY